MSTKNNHFKPLNWFHSFDISLTGLKLILKNERNFRIQLGVAVAVIIAGAISRFNHEEWVSIVLVIALVLISEAFNSVIEALADTISQDYRVNIKYAKDVAAGAVLISTIVSVIAGVMIFYPHLYALAQSYQLLP